MNAADSVNTDIQNAAQTLGEVYEQLPHIIVQLLLAALAIVAGVLLLRFFRFIISRRIKRKRPVDARTVKQTETFRSLVNSMVSYLMYFFIALVVLKIFGIDLTSILAVAGIGSIAIGFGAQSLVKDVISGLFLWIEGNIAVGDVITAAGFNGRVEAISLRSTLLRGTDGTLYAIPNGDIRTVASKSRDYHIAQVNVTLAHGQDIPRAQAALTDECALLQQRLSLPQAPVVYGCIASDARCVTLRVECACGVDDYWAIEREIRMAMFDRLRREDLRA